jgi:hypothetical protein
MNFGSLSRLTAVVLAGLVGAVPSSVAAQEAIYVRNHRGLQVSVQPIGRAADVVVVREIYKDKSEKKGSVNDIYAYDCKAGVLRYIDPGDTRVMKDAEFYDGVYKKAHERICSSYKDPFN